MAATIQDTIAAINAACKSDAKYSEYSCKTVSWDDAQRGTVGGGLSCWGSNITDTRLWERHGKQLFTVRSDNWNEKLGRVSTKDVALLVPSEDGEGLKPTTLRTFLKTIGKERHGGYAGLSPACDLDSALDSEVSIRFQTTFLPVEEDPKNRSTLEFAPEAYNYNTRDDSDPRNLVLLCTTQGSAVQQDGKGAKKLFHHAVAPDKQVHRYWLEAEQSEHKVGGAQEESAEEKADALARGKATASVIGVKALGTRFNILMTIQVPLQQKPQHSMRSLGGMGGGMESAFLCSMGGMSGMGATKGKGKGGSTKGGSSTLQCATKAAKSYGAAKKKEASGMSAMFSGFFGGGMSAPAPAPCAEAAMFAPCYMSSMSQEDFFEDGFELQSDLKRVRSCAEEEEECRKGRANAARVSRGSEVDVWKGLSVKEPKRNADERITVTVVIYNTVAGGVPCEADVKAAVDDMEELYASCQWNGHLMDAGAGFMKKELTVNDMQGIKAKVASQPYQPPSTTVLNPGLFPEDSDEEEFVDVSQAVHKNVICDVSGMHPIIGVRFHRKGVDYDLCQAEFNKLPQEERALYEAIAEPGSMPIDAATFSLSAM